MTRITVSTKNAQLVAKSLEDLSFEIPKISKGRIYGRVTRAKERITKYPAEWAGTLPKNWFKSDRQRRKVFALLNEGKIPYVRTYAYRDAWQAVNVPDGYRLSTSGRGGNYAKWVGGDAYGDNQAKIHQGRWPVARDVIDEELEKLPQEVQEHLTMAARRRGLS